MAGRIWGDTGDAGDADGVSRGGTLQPEQFPTLM